MRDVFAARAEGMRRRYYRPYQKHPRSTNGDWPQPVSRLHVPRTVRSQARTDVSGTASRREPLLGSFEKEGPFRSSAPRDAGQRARRSRKRQGKQRRARCREEVPHLGAVQRRILTPSSATATALSALASTSAPQQPIQQIRLPLIEVLPLAPTRRHSTPGHTHGHTSPPYLPTPD